MLPFLYTTASSAFLFLTSFFFLSFPSFKEGASWAYWWIHVSDLPLLVTGCMAGSIALHRSLGDHPTGKIFPFVAGMTLCVLIFLASLNFLSPPSA